MIGITTTPDEIMEKTDEMIGRTTTQNEMIEKQRRQMR